MARSKCVALRLPGRGTAIAFVRPSRALPTGCLTAMAHQPLPAFASGCTPADNVNPLHFRVLDVGNLPKDDAKTVFLQILGDKGFARAPKLADADWEAVYEVRREVGGEEPGTTRHAQAQLVPAGGRRTHKPEPEGVAIRVPV